MKKFISVFMISVLLATSMPVLAHNGVDSSGYEDYIDRVRVCFDLPEDLPDVNFRQFDKTVEISWRSEDGDRSYSASIDEHGCITHFYGYNAAADTDTAAKLSKQECIAKAEAVLKAVYGDSSADFERVNLSIDSGSVRLYYRYTQNGIPVDAGASIVIDRATGKTESFSGLCGKLLGYTYAKPESLKLLTADEIYANYKSTDSIDIYYNLFYDPETEEKTVKPVYIITPKNINASTGETITPQSEDDYIEAEEAAVDNDMDAGETTAASKRVTEIEKKAIKQFENLITKETADANIKKFFPQIKGLTPESSNISTYGDYPQINLHYADRSDTDTDANAMLNAQTGEVLSFTNYKYDSKGRTADIKKTESIADELFKSIEPDIYRGGEYKKTSDAEHASVTYKRLHDGIRVNGQDVTIACNNDLTIREYRKTWDKLDFPSAKNAVAERDVFENSKAEGFGLKYIITDNAAVLSYGYTSGGGYYSRMRGEIFYDAITGEKINPYNGTPQIENEYGNYTDLEGSPYREVIETLAEYGYTLPYTEFKPNAPITIEDFYTFIDLNIVYTDDKPYFGSALYSKEQAQKTLTKYDIAKIFVNESGYTDLAAKDIFKTDFTDVSAENTGVVAIASAMGFIPEKGGEFNGTKQITRGEAAEYIYKCLDANNAL